jgi:HAD superfamily hydrolase (TIGR01509 family)
MSSPAAVVFDFDGLILDTESNEFESWSDEFSRHGVKLELNEWVKCVGGGPQVWSVTDHLLLLTGGKADVVEAERRRHEACTRLNLNLRPNPGVVDWIDMLEAKGIPFAIASSSLLTWVEEHLVIAGLRSRFSVIVTRDQVERAKPWPDLYLEACRRLATPPHQTAAFEDSVNGVRAAKAAGMVCVAAPGPITSHMNFSSADLKVSSLEDLSWKMLCDAFFHAATEAK